MTSLNHQCEVCSNGQDEYLHAFYTNSVIFSEAGIFLTFISYLSVLRPTLPQFYVFKMIVSTLRFMWNRLV